MARLHCLPHLSFTPFCLPSVVVQRSATTLRKLRSLGHSLYIPNHTRQLHLTLPAQFWRQLILWRAWPSREPRRTSQPHWFRSTPCRPAITAPLDQVMCQITASQPFSTEQCLADRVCRTGLRIPLPPAWLPSPVCNPPSISPCTQRSTALFAPGRLPYQPSIGHV